jgi:hypothetical protein
MKTFFVKFWRLIFPAKSNTLTENTDVVIEPIEITENLEIAVTAVETPVEKKAIVKKQATKKAATQKAPAKNTNKKNK